MAPHGFSWPQEVSYTGGWELSAHTSSQEQNVTVNGLRSRKCARPHMVSLNTLPESLFAFPLFSRVWLCCALCLLKNLGRSGR